MLFPFSFFFFFLIIYSLLIRIFVLYLHTPHHPKIIRRIENFVSNESTHLGIYVHGRVDTKYSDIDMGTAAAVVSLSHDSNILAGIEFITSYDHSILCHTLYLIHVIYIFLSHVT